MSRGIVLRECAHPTEQIMTGPGPVRLILLFFASDWPEWSHIEIPKSMTGKMPLVSLLCENAALFQNYI